MSIDISKLQDATIKHARLLEVRDKVLAEIHRPGGASVIMVVGPTGVGKSTGIELIKEEITSEVLELLQTDREMVPYGYAVAPGPFGSGFDWKSLLADILISLHEPMMEKSIHFGPVFRTDDTYVYRQATKPKLLQQLGIAVEQRRPRAIIIDEAQHLLKVSGAKSALHQMEAIKDLARIARTKLILVGTYELAQVFNLSGQLARRTAEVEFARYTLAEDRDDFFVTLKTMQKVLPCAVDLQGADMRKLLYTGSLGCIGVLWQWALRAAAAADGDGRSEITEADFAATMLSDVKLRRMVSEIREGEARMATWRKDPDRTSQLNDLLRQLVSGTLPQASANPHAKPQAHGRARRRPGERSPHRDPVGETGD